MVLESEIWLYYFGGNGPHSGNRNSSFAMAKMRSDGFAGITNLKGTETAYVKTYSLLVNAKYLLVTVDSLGGGGFAKVGLQGSDEYSTDNCHAISSNVTDFAVSWTINGESENDLKEFMGKEVVLEIELKSAILYTFLFSNDTQGVSKELKMPKL